MIQPKLTIPVGSWKALARHREAIEELVLLANEGRPAHLRQDARIDFSRGFFNSSTIDIDYSAQHLTDQYPRVATYLAQNFGIAEQADHKSQVPLLLEQSFGSVASRQAAQQVELRHADLLGRGTAAANNFDLGPFHNGAGNAVEEHDFSAEDQHPSRQETWLEDALAHHPGVILGEGHADDVNRDLLASRLPQLKQAGVNTIYLEGLRSDYQDHVDAYLAGGPNAAMSPELHRFLAAKGSEGMTYHRLLQRIKAEGGLRAKAIDAPEATTRFHPESVDRDIVREVAMNQFAHEAIGADAQARGAGKYVILTGRAHAVAQPQRANTVGIQGRVPGLSEMLGIPAFAAQRPAPVVVPQPEPPQLGPHQLGLPQPQLEAQPEAQLLPQQLPLSEVQPLSEVLGSSGGSKVSNDDEN